MPTGVYPSIDEIMPDLLLSRIPVKLADEITERYRVLGKKYLTGRFHDDGREINGCMDNSSLQDMREEVIDAVFNILVYIFKCRQFELVMPDNAWNILTGLIEIYSATVLMQVEEESDAVAKS